MNDEIKALLYIILMRNGGEMRIADCELLDQTPLPNETIIVQRNPDYQGVVIRIVEND